MKLQNEYGFCLIPASVLLDARTNAAQKGVLAMTYALESAGKSATLANLMDAGSDELIELIEAVEGTKQYVQERSSSTSKMCLTKANHAQDTQPSTGTDKR